MRIIGFTGYHDGKNVIIKGRLITQDYKAPKKESSWWNNLKSNVSRLIAKPIKGAAVTITFGNQIQEAKSDKRGFFETLFNTKKKGWQQAIIKVGDEKEKTKVLCSTNKKGIISDIDDTFLTTHTSYFIKKIRLFFLKNAKTREAVNGMPAFYRKTKRQLFYVSSSSFELYDFIREFCEAQDMPKGPYLLSPRRVLMLKRKHGDKERRIRELLNGYNTTFILVGDDAQKDPYIYKKIAQEHPTTIEAIFIRSVKNKEKTQAYLQNCPVPCYVEYTAQELYNNYKQLTRKRKK